MVGSAHPTGGFMRIGPGPVFVVELVAAARRWQTYAARAGVLAVLFASLLLAWVGEANTLSSPNGMTTRQYAELGSTFATAVLSTQLALVLLAAPAATAGAVCL